MEIIKYSNEGGSHLVQQFLFQTFLSDFWIWLHTGGIFLSGYD